ncbi:beta barrel domain-containing protein [Streptomyces misionensis]|uniref:beta barrel domain-containing protein n=1 Tax=Streptomyces misionensis TaxID=67331 RepID=UPI0036BD701C
MSGLPAVKVGDPLILVTGNRYRGDEPVTVARIGRKYLYVTRQNGREYSGRFHLDGTEDSQYSARERLYTPEQYEEEKQRANLFMELLAAGINVEHRVRPEVTTDQLRALLAVMRPTS